MKIKTHLDNPYLDFVVKSILLLYFMPYLIHLISLYTFFTVGAYTHAWDGEGVLTGIVLGGVLFYLSILLGFILALTIIIFFNKKFLSGNRILEYSPHKKFLRTRLFILSFIIFVPIFITTFPALVFSRITLSLYDVFYYLLDKTIGLPTPAK